MSDPRLQVFVEKALMAGGKYSSIREQLIEAKWPVDEVDAALASWMEVNGVAVPRPQPSQAAGETFQYLLMFAAFFIGAGGLMDVLFAFYNAWIPPHDGYASFNVTFGVAALIVAFPVFAILYARASAAAQADPNSRNSPARRWIIYLTLLITAVSTMGGVISLVTGVLEGRGDLNGGLKMATMVGLSVATFTNYLWELRRTGTATSGLRRTVLIGCSVAILSVIVGGMVFSKSYKGNTYDYYENGQRRDDDRLNRAPAPEKAPPEPADTTPAAAP